MDCSDFLRLAEALRAGEVTRYACAVFEWHRRTCPRCAAATARAVAPRPAIATRKRAQIAAR